MGPATRRWLAATAERRKAKLKRLIEKPANWGGVDWEEFDILDAAIAELRAEAERSAREVLGDE